MITMLRADKYREIATNLGAETEDRMRPYVFCFFFFAAGNSTLLRIKR